MKHINYGSSFNNGYNIEKKVLNFLGYDDSYEIMLSSLKSGFTPRTMVFNVDTVGRSIIDRGIIQIKQLGL